MTFPLPSDPRLCRPDPDALPPFRCCRRCGGVFALDSQHFAEDTRRFPWNLSRFDSRCLECVRTYSRAWSVERKATRNAKDRARRAQRKAVKAKGPVIESNAKWLAGMHPENVRGILAAREARAVAKTRKALQKRRILRLFGARKTWVQVKIERDMQAARSRRKHAKDWGKSATAARPRSR